MVTLPLLKQNMIWHNMMWYAMMLYDIILYDMILYDITWSIWYIDMICWIYWYTILIAYDKTWYDVIALIWHDTRFCKHGITWYHMIRYHIIWHGVWYDTLRYCMIWYRMVNICCPGMIWYHVSYDMIPIWYETNWYHMDPNGMLLLDLRQYDMIGHNTGYSMVWCSCM